jgi:hypothetical protein
VKVVATNFAVEKEVFQRRGSVLGGFERPKRHQAPRRGRKKCR